MAICGTQPAMKKTVQENPYDQKVLDIWFPR